MPKSSLPEQSSMLRDDIFLDAAIAGRVHCLVTGDDDLKGDQTLKTKMRDEYDIKIMGVPEFLAVLTSRK
jgi:predicted nucleic acid-binding protein